MLNQFIMPNTNQSATVVAIERLDLGSINSELENAICLLNSSNGEEAIEDMTSLLDDYTHKSGFDEVLIANASTSLLRFYTTLRNVKRSVMEAYRSLNGKEVKL